jgi:SAM-dependent methyltransferase
MNNVVINKRIDFIIDQIMKFDVKNKKTSAVLDLGCGIGVNTVPVGSLGCQVTAVDVDDNSINYCKNHNTQPNIEYKVGDAETIDLKNKYGVIITSEILEHVIHPKLLIKNVDHHLEYGGIWILSIPNGFCLWEIVVSRFIHKGKLVSWLYKSPRFYKLLTGSETPFMSKNIFCFHENFYSYGRLKKLIESNGFKVKFVRHASLGILPEWDFFRYIKWIECKISDLVPHSLAGGWFMVMERK